MKLVDMKKENKQESMPQPCMAYESKYPYGLCISLEEESIKKLGIKEMPEVGEYMTITAKVEVQRTSKDESMEGGARRCISLQIVEMGIGKVAEKKDVAKELYED